MKNVALIGLVALIAAGTASAVTVTGTWGNDTVGDGAAYIDIVISGSAGYFGGDLYIDIPAGAAVPDDINFGFFAPNGYNLMSDYQALIDAGMANDAESVIAAPWDAGLALESDSIFVDGEATPKNRTAPAGQVMVVLGSLTPADVLMARIGFTGVDEGALPILGVQMDGVDSFEGGAFVPEPATMSLLALAGLGLLRRRNG